MVRRLLQGLATVLLVPVIYLNYHLYYTPHIQGVNQDVVEQLRFLREELHTGAGQRMQQLYPEGLVYLNSLYALAWIELLPYLPATTPLGREARVEAQWALQEIQSPVAQSIFNPDLPLPSGAFYQGWSAYVLGRYLTALPPSERDTTHVNQFRQQCARIATALENSPTPYLESYSGAAWPADGVMDVAGWACPVSGKRRLGLLPLGISIRGPLSGESVGQPRW